MTTTRKVSKGSRSRGLGEGNSTSASLVNAGDTAPTLTLAGVEHFTVGEAISAAQEAELAAVRSFGSESSDGLAAILEGGAPDDVARLREALSLPTKDKVSRRTRDDLADDWRR